MIHESSSLFLYDVLHVLLAFLRCDRMPGRLHPHVGVEPLAARAERAAARRLRQSEPSALHLTGEQVRRVRRRRQRGPVAGGQRLSALFCKTPTAPYGPPNINRQKQMNWLLCLSWFET